MSLLLDTTWVIETCCWNECDIQWAMPETIVHSLKRTHNWFHCPNGHSQHYSGKSDVEKARDERDEALRNATRLRARLDQQKAEARYQGRRAAALQGWLTRLKRRIANGVCPCCKRSFLNVRRHIKGQHPGFVERWGAALTGREASAGT